MLALYDPRREDWDAYAIGYRNLVESDHTPTSEEVRAWGILATVTYALHYKHDLAKLTVRGSEGHYYTKASQMERSLRDRGWIYVDHSDSEHPTFSLLTNIAFRGVHDLLGHLDIVWARGVKSFMWGGELATHIRLLRHYDEAAALLGHSEYERRLMAAALTTENLGQTGYALWHKREHGEYQFLPQRIGFLEGVDVQEDQA